MRVVIAPDSFKGTATAADAACAIAAGWRSVRPGDELVQLPTADGGEGTIDALERSLVGATRVSSVVSGPLREQIEADWLRFTDAAGNDVGVVELAATSGLPLLREPAPLAAHTRGFGEQISLALDAGVTRLLLAIGGSSSTDGGTGALTALGARFLDGGGAPLRLGGGALHRLAAVDTSRLRPLPPGGATLLTDVLNPLTGPIGAASSFAPQKGAGPEQVAQLERGLLALTRHLDADPAIPGAGAAGGTGFGMLAWGALAQSGSAVVCDTIGLPAALLGADLVITGEGSYDAQSSSGKAVSRIELLAAHSRVQVALVAGRITADSAAVARISLEDLAGSAPAAMADAIHWLASAGRQLARSYD